MKIGQVLDRVNEKKPNAVDQDDLVSDLNDLESVIVLEVFKESEYTTLSPGDTGRELKAPEPYTRIYSEYLVAIIDKYNEDMESYSMSSRTFNATMDDLKKYVRRNGLDKSTSSGRFHSFF